MQSVKTNKENFIKVPDVSNIAAWVTNTYYLVGSIIYYTDNKIYKCITAHTSNTFAGDVANWTELSASSASTVGSSILKGNGVGGIANAVASTDYAPATSGTSILKANAGGFANAVASTDYAPATTGTSILKANGSGGFTNAIAGTDYATKGIETWVSGTSYPLNSIIAYPVNNRIYRCINANSDTVFTSTKWIELSPTITPWISAGGSKFNNQVKIVAAQSDGKLLIGGAFTNYNGQTGKNYLIRLNTDGTEDTSFSVLDSANGQAIFYSGNIYAITVQPDGKILVGGNFYHYDAGTSSQTYYLCRLNSDGRPDFTFNTNVRAKFTGDTSVSNIGAVNTILVQSDNSILVSGNFTNYNSIVGRSYLVRLNFDGTEDTAFNTNITGKFNSWLGKIALQTNGQIVCGGNFTNYNNTGKDRLIRLNSNGVEDTTFSTNAVVSGVTPKFNSDIRSIAIQSDGSIFVSGNFTIWSGIVGRSYLMKFNSIGVEDSTFNATNKFNNIVNTVAIQPSDNKIICGGNFTNWNGLSGDNYFIRLNTNGTEDTIFRDNAAMFTGIAAFNGQPRYILIQSDNKIVVGGDFVSHHGNTSLRSLIRFYTDGTEDVSFSNTGVSVNTFYTPGDIVYSSGVALSPTAKQKIYICINANNDSNFTVTNWAELSTGGVTPWSGGVRYVLNDIVYNSSNNRIYRMLAASDNSGIDPTTNANWQELSGGGILPWATSTNYIINDIIHYTNYKIYKCIVAHTSGTFATDLAANNWVELSGSRDMSYNDNSTLVLPLNTSTTIKFATLVWNNITGGTFNTANGIFTSTEIGRFMVVARAAFKAPNTTPQIFSLNIVTTGLGVGVANNYMTPPAANVPVFLTATAIINITTVGQTISVAALSGQATTLDPTAGYTNLSIIRL